MQSPNPGVLPSTLTVSHKACWCGSTLSSVTFWHPSILCSDLVVYATMNNKTSVIQLEDMPLEAHLEKKILFNRLAKSWLSKSRLVRQQKKLTPARELPGLSLSTRAIASNRELPLSQSPRCFTHRGRSLPFLPVWQPWQQWRKGGAWAPLMNQSLVAWPHLLERKLRNIIFTWAFK